MTRPTIIAGNWKMYKTVLEGIQFLDALVLPDPPRPGLEVMIFPPATALYTLGRHRPGITIGAQNLHEEPSGAYTGEISASMVRECATVALIGHSERRHVFMEDDSRINRKLRAALNAGLRPMLCIGEKLEERQGGQTEELVLRQLDRGLEGLSAPDLGSLMLAYEPVWAIGTGLTASPQQAQDVHNLIRKHLTGLGLSQVPILYGGSVKPDNARDLLIMPDIDGLLIGGASLQAQNFSDIIALAFELNR
jgi:triosephosphate isomerase